MKLLNNTQNSTILYLDFLFNLLLAFVVLFSIAIIQNKKDEDTQGKIIPKAEFVIFLDWDDNSTDDLDVWLKYQNRVVYYGNRETQLVHLDHDDLGISNDTYKDVDGQEHVIESNGEIMTIRGNSDNTFSINVEVYRKSSTKATNFTIRIIKMNPYQKVFEKSYVATENRQRFSIVNFKTDSTGEVVSVDQIPNIFIFDRLMAQ